MINLYLVLTSRMLLAPFFLRRNNSILRYTIGIRNIILTKKGAGARTF